MSGWMQLEVGAAPLVIATCACYRLRAVKVLGGEIETADIQIPGYTRAKKMN